MKAFFAGNVSKMRNIVVLPLQVKTAIELDFYSNLEQRILISEFERHTG
jgi:predicted HAD superfamily phosphohydrolase YqeG